MSWPPPTTTSTCCTGPASRAWARPTSPASPGPSSTATTPSSRWTPTARTPRRSCRGCSTRSRGADAVIGSRWVAAARSSTGRCAGCSCRAARNLYTRMVLGMPVKDATGGYRAYRLPVAATRSTSTTVDVAGLLLPGRPDLARDRHGLPDRRGADHLRRARARRVQDERLHHRGGAVEGHGLGCPVPPRARAAYVQAE